MKYGLPTNHGLSDETLNHLVFREEANPSLTDAQYAALDAGVGRGESLLVVSPTSTGKTQIALWAIAKAIESSANTVYLVTLRALARQKFEDFCTLLLPTYLAGDKSAIVIATGDYVIDADGEAPKDPLSSPLLVATYEKYLAMLSSSGIPSRLSNTVIVCDEIQLLGDQHRGQNVEILLTLIKNAGWKQFVGLSAVLHRSDANNLAAWLGVPTVIATTREKHLQYECWTSSNMAVARSSQPDQIQDGLPLPVGGAPSTISALTALLQENRPPVPIIIFCMTKKAAFDGAERFIDAAHSAKSPQLSLAFNELPETAANEMLSRALGYRVACHTADLTDEERKVVEDHLLEGKLDVVFATSTLAAGVNFPLGAAIFDEWKRWDSDSMTRVPIDSADFHNMAGRVGRMGFDHEQGRIVFFASGLFDVRKARDYLNLAAMPELEPRVSPEKFEQLALQLVASGLTATRAELQKLVCTTFSALREQEHNLEAFARWPAKLSKAVDSLLNERYLIASAAGELATTPVGKALAYSGLLPKTCTYLLKYAGCNAETLVKYLPSLTAAGDLNRLAFVLFHACLASPEFRSSERTRYLPWPIDKGNLFDADIYSADMVDPVWMADVPAVNATKLCCNWMDGVELKQLEGALPNLSAGMLHELFRNLCWMLQGFAAILSAASDERVLPALRAMAIAGPSIDLKALSKLPRLIRRLSLRVNAGLPDDVLWMQSLNVPGSDFVLRRYEILALRSEGYAKPELVMLGSAVADAVRVKVFVKTKPSPSSKGNWLRDTCRDWKKNQRKRAAERHVKRGEKCPRADLITKYYEMKEKKFEEILEEIFTHLQIKFQKLDDGKTQGAPDYLLTIEDSPEIVLEVKTKLGDKLVDHNDATEVLAASEIHGHKSAFCVTLCHPGVDPSVPLIVAACGRLSVVESHDLGEALLRVCEGSMSHKQLWHWLATPGQALSSDLPFKEY